MGGWSLTRNVNMRMVEGTLNVYGESDINMYMVEGTFPTTVRPACAPFRVPRAVMWGTPAKEMHQPKFHYFEKSEFFFRCAILRTYAIIGEYIRIILILFWDHIILRTHKNDLTAIMWSWELWTCNSGSWSVVAGVKPIS